MNIMKVVILKELSGSLDYLNEIIGIADSDKKVLEMCGDFIRHYYRNFHDIRYENNEVIVKFNRFNKSYNARFKVEEYILNEMELL